MPKTVVQELADAQARIAALESESTMNAGKLAAAEAKVAEFTASAEANAKAHADALAQAKEEADNAAVAAKAESDKLTAAIVAMTAERDEAVKKLASPAYQMANAKGSDKPVPEGGSEAATSAMKQAEALAEYRKLDGKPDEQKAFRVAHWRELGCNEEK